MTGDTRNKADGPDSPSTPGGIAEFGMLGREGGAAASPEARTQASRRSDRRGGIVIYIASDSIGRDNSAHGRDLLIEFLYTLTDVAPQPQAIILVNTAVNLARPDSPAAENLCLLQEQGVQILIAEESLLDARGVIKVGKPVTMHVILNALLQAEKVITP